jgi:cytoskeletal protein CcmA (bactofilin family)
MVLEGTVSGSGDIHIDGTVKGAITCESSVRIAKQGRIHAQIHARAVEVAGTVDGDITADERILLEPSATVTGDITAPRILIQDGATFRGQVNMTSRTTPTPGADSATDPKKQTQK